MKSRPFLAALLALIPALAAREGHGEHRDADRRDHDRHADRRTSLERPMGLKSHSHALCEIQTGSAVPPVS